jgi:hypothetical protein
LFISFEEKGMKRVVTTFIVIAVALSITGMAANASIVTYNGTVNPFQLGGTATTSGLSMFNGSLGTLTGVQVTLNLEATPFAEPFNASFSPAVFTTSDWARCGYDPALNAWAISHGSDSWSLAVPTVSTGNIYGTGQTIGPFSGLILVGSTSAPVNLTAAGLDLAGYIGAGSLSFGTTGTGNYAIYDGPLYAGGGANLTGIASVTYNYTPIPEPATMCLLGLGAFALRRKK